MSDNKAEFDRIVTLLTEQDDVFLGKMMSAPGLKYRNKVFAFYYQEKMCFKLVTTKSLDALEVPYELLNPFKTKPPLKGWFIIDAEFSMHWEMLAKEALEKMKS